MSKLQPVRGTYDLLPDEYRRFAHVIDSARDVARLYGYREMATPIFEFTELFARGIGEATDDHELKGEGKLQEAKGKVQKAVGDAKAAVKKVADL